MVLDSGPRRQETRGHLRPAGSRGGSPGWHHLSSLSKSQARRLQGKAYGQARKGCSPRAGTDSGHLPPLLRPTEGQAPAMLTLSGSRCGRDWNPTFCIQSWFPFTLTCWTPVARLVGPCPTRGPVWQGLASAQSRKFH